jgi:hypothetical protein
MMRPDAKVEKVYLYPKPVDFRKPIVTEYQGSPDSSMQQSLCTPQITSVAIHHRRDGETAGEWAGAVLTDMGDLESVRLGGEGVYQY